MPKKRFILVDQSVVKIGGHHYEYARHVLNGALEAGYETVLVANKACKLSQANGHSILPLFTLTFWGENGGWSLVPYALRTMSSLKKLKAIAKIRLFNTELGHALILLRGREYTDLILHYKFFDNPFKTLGFGTGLVVAVPLYGLTWLGIKLRLFAAVKRMWQWAGGLGQMFIQALKPWGRIGRPLKHIRVRRNFEKDISKVIAKLKPGVEDIIFIPTISPEELDGLHNCFVKHAGLSCSWALLFRRNIFNTRESGYSAEVEAMRPFSSLLESVFTGPCGQYVRYFTDTEELSRQYERITSVPFATLPIPHTNERIDSARADGPLTVTYLGDARSEKGYQHLPFVVDSLLKFSTFASRFRFVIQSNYNVPDGEPAVVVARSQLASYPAEQVELLLDPLSSEEYRDLIMRGDVTLLMYDRNNYHARSSGIVIEALAAGTPVVVPGGTWLSKQLLESTIEYYKKLLEDADSVITWTCDWKRNGTSERTVLGRGRFSIGDHVGCYCQAKLTGGEAYLLIVAKIPSSESDTCLHLEATQWSRPYKLKKCSILLEYSADRKEAWGIVPIDPSSVAAKICVKRAFAPSAVFISELTVRSVSFSNRRPPRGSGGLTYNSVNEVPELLKEIEQNREHYLHTASEIADELLQWHNASVLVSEIETAVKVEANV